MKGFSTCFIHLTIFFVSWVLFHATFLIRKGNAVWIVQYAHHIWVTDHDAHFIAGHSVAINYFAIITAYTAKAHSLDITCRFRQANLKFNAENYKSLKFEVTFMTTRDLIRSPPAKIEPGQSLSIPRNAMQIQS